LGKSHGIDTVQAVIEYKNQGTYSSREIGRILGLSKSSVNDIWNRYIDSICESSLVRLEKKPYHPRVLLFDLETSASIVATFGRFRQNIGHDNVLDEGGWLLSAAWKYLDEPTIFSSTCTPEEALAKDDSRVVADLYEAFEQADVVCGHNCKSFDMAVFKARLSLLGFPMHKPVKQVDTLLIARSMKFNSRKLDSLADYFNLDRKRKHEGIKLWIDCQQGKKSALDEMKEYNRTDIEVLEQLYHKLKSFDTKAPNLGLYFDDAEMRCPVCASLDVAETSNKVYTQVSVFEEVQCNTCGHRSRKRTAVNTKEQRKNLLLSVQS
jgi:hypothetical protein